MKRKCVGHLRMDGDSVEEQSLEAHCRNTANYAAQFLSEMGLAIVGFLAGLLHDAGKARELFRLYLERAILSNDPMKRGSVNHTFAACRLLLEKYHSDDEIGYSELTAELLAYACGAHHGLFDCIDEKSRCGFLHRIEDSTIEYDDTIVNYLSECISEKEIEQLFERCVEELQPVLEKIFELPGEAEPYFYVGLLERMLLSAVIDGDRQDTAEFMNGVKYPSFPSGAARQEKWWECLRFAERELNSLPQETPIQKARRRISDQCAAFAYKKGGIIRLNVPTGGGKTLSSLRFALTHAAVHNKTRIIFTSSLLSVLDQNAKVIRDNLPDQSMILEHHSNVVRPKDENENVLWEQMAEQWSAPVIITTLVQLLNTFFSGKTSCIRRFHGLIGSVIVVDEIQSLSSSKITNFNLAVNFLTEICGATVVLCSATQPCLEAAEHPLVYMPYEMVPVQEELWKEFRRTEIQNAGEMSEEQLCDFIRTVFQKVKSLLVICNTKKEASNLYQALNGTAQCCFHLSAAMCMEHRKSVQKAMEKALEAPDQKVLCISTQVIEAGVDISFERVIRLNAGMDSIVQAAGRCNRNRESSELAPVYIVRLKNERLSMLKDIQRGQAATIALLDFFGKEPERFSNDLSSGPAIEYYYKCLYRSLNCHYQDDIREGLSLFDLLSENTAFLSEGVPGNGQFFMQQAFKTAGELFSVFDENTMDILVPYENGRKLRTELIQLEKEKWDYQKIEVLVKKTAGYCISIYPYQQNRLLEQGALVPLFDGRVHVLLDGFYDDARGFTLEESFSEV